MKFILLFVIILSTLTCKLAALQCYSCEGKNGDDCVQNPEKVKTITCKKNERCYVMRSDSTRAFGDYVLIKRGCKAKGTIPVSNNKHEYVSSQVCSVDKCNSGDGTRLDFGGFDFNGFDYSGFGYNANHFGKNKNNAASAITPLFTSFIVVIPVVFNLIYMRPN